MLEVCADLANMGAHLDLEAEHTGCRTKVWTQPPCWWGGQLTRRSFTKCEGEALPSGFPWFLDVMEAWRVKKDEYEGKDGHRMAALLRGILNPRARWDGMYSEGRDLGDMLASWEKNVTPNNIAEGADLHQAAQVATVMEHAPAAYRDLLKVVPLANRETARSRAKMDADAENL